MASFLSFEINRGATLLASEQPVMVGDYLIKEDESKRQYSFSAGHTLSTASIGNVY